MKGGYSILFILPPSSSILLPGVGASNSAIIPCALLAVLQRRCSQTERNWPVESKTSAGKQANTLAAIRELRSPLGLTGARQRQNAVRSETSVIAQT